MKKEKRSDSDLEKKTMINYSKLKKLMATPFGSRPQVKELKLLPLKVFLGIRILILMLPTNYSMLFPSITQLPLIKQQLSSIEIQEKPLMFPEEHLITEKD
jgi:hypothetical protein